MRVESAVTSVSWIPSETVRGLMKAGFSTGLSHYDAPPPAQLGDVSELRDQDAFRFANALTAWVEFDGTTPVTFGQSGETVMGSTTVRVAGIDATFAAVAMPELRPDPVVGESWVTFTQTVGGRTALPLPRRIAQRPFFRLTAPIVWTTLQLTLHADGRSEIALVGASPFPRHWVYDATGKLALKAGVADWATWVGQPSWTNSPWGDQDSTVLVAPAETDLERELAGLLMHGAAKPKIRNLAAGDVIARQGDPGSTLVLILDGIVAVDVSGSPIGDLGPGAVVGEHAILDHSPRTATLVATTAVRIAEVPGAEVDREALAELATGHRREFATPAQS